MTWELGFLAIAIVQGLVIAIDEFYCHMKRPLPQWEKNGHPLDTLTLVICFGVLLYWPESAIKPLIYGLCAVFSCLFVTKDEWVHAQHATAFEHWLHSLLFILHPSLLILAYQIRLSSEVLLKVQLGVLVLFAAYQVIYWKLLRKADVV